MLIGNDKQNVVAECYGSWKNQMWQEARSNVANFEPSSRFNLNSRKQQL